MANLLNATQVADRTALLLKAETGGYGVDSIPTGALDWIEARDVSHTPRDIESAERNIVLPYMGNLAPLTTAKWSKFSCWVAMAGSGTLGEAPALGPLLLAGSFAETVDAGVSVTYNLISDGFGSASAYVYIHREWQKMLGLRAALKGAWDAKGIYKLNVDAQSLYSIPTVVADLPAVTRDGWPIEQAVNAVNTGPIKINGTDLAASQFEWSVGEGVQRISLPGPQLEVVIDERKPTASVTVLSMPLSTWNPFALADADTPITLENTHGIGAGKQVKTEIKGRITGVERARVNKMAAWKLTISPEPVDGNDEITLTFL